MSTNTIAGKEVIKRSSGQSPPTARNTLSTTKIRAWKSQKVWTSRWHTQMHRVYILCVPNCEHDLEKTWYHYGTSYTPDRPISNEISRLKLITEATIAPQGSSMKHARDHVLQSHKISSPPIIVEYQHTTEPMSLGKLAKATPAMKLSDTSPGHKSSAHMCSVNC